MGSPRHMRTQRLSIPVPGGFALAGIALAGIALATAAGAQKGKPTSWDAFPGGWTLRSKVGTFHTTLDKEELPKIAARIAELQPFYEKHFGTKLKKGWTFVVLEERAQYQKYATEVTKGRKAVQGQCFRDRKIVTVCHHKRIGWLTTLSHEYGHAYYDCQGPIWLREGIASLVEVAEVQGRGKKKKMTIPVNPARLRGLKIYQRQKHYQSIKHLISGKKEADGYGYSYEHGWSLHYFLFHRDPKKYRAFLSAVRRKTGPDLSAEIKKFFKLDLDTLDKQWREFTAKLETQPRKKKN